MRDRIVMSSKDIFSPCKFLRWATQRKRKLKCLYCKYKGEYNSLPAMLYGKTLDDYSLIIPQNCPLEKIKDIDIDSLDGCCDKEHYALFLKALEENKKRIDALIEEITNDQK